MSHNTHDDLPETDETLLTGLRAEDSVLFRTERSSDLIQLSTLAEAHVAQQIETEPSAVDLIAVTDAGDAAPLLLPVCTPASARPSQLVKLLSIAAIIMGLATAGLAYAVVRGPAPAPQPKAEITPTRPEPLPIPRPIDDPVSIAVPEPAVSLPEELPEPVLEPAPKPTVTVAKPKVRPAPKPTKPAPKPEPAKPATRPCGDEIECLLAGVDDSPAPALVETPAPDPTVPDRLDTLAISEGMKKAQSRAAGCDDRFGGGGNVKLKLTVAADGTVSKVSVTSTPNPELGACVADAARAQRFPRTHIGATFAWLFPYR